MGSVTPYTIKIEQQRKNYKGEPVIVTWDFGSSGIRCVVNTLDLPMPPVLSLKSNLDIPKAFNGTKEERIETQQQIIDIVKTMQLNIGNYPIVADDGFATASMRDQETGERPAEGAEEFVERLFKETGLDVRIIMGEEEGRLATLGVLSQFEHLLQVVVGDLGGSSLELGIGTQDENGENKHVGDSITFPLGAKIVAKYMLDQVESACEEARGILAKRDAKISKKKKQWEAEITFDQRLEDLTVKIVRERTKAHVKEAFSSKKARKFLDKVRGMDWAAVGGALRSIGFDWALEVGIELKHHTQDNTIDVREFNEHAGKVARMSPGEKLMRGFQRKRVNPLDTTVAADVIAEVIAEELGAQKVTISRVSVRDGAAYETVQRHEAAQAQQQIEAEPVASKA